MLPADLLKRVDVKGLRVLDVGCWEGDLCVEAVRRGAVKAVGVDACVCSSLRENLERCPEFAFIQADVTSERFLEVDPAHVVFSTGVLYHLPDPMSYLFRLRALTLKRLVLGTAIWRGGKVPAMRFYPGDSLLGNSSNWWAPNLQCLHRMLETAGFLLEDTLEVRDRAVVFCRRGPAGTIDHEKTIPRRADLMPLHGGERRK